MPKLSSKTDDAPAFQFYVKDWLVDTRVLNLKERGVWADTLAVMWTSPERGVLLMPSGRNPMRTPCESAMRNACDVDTEWLRGTYGVDAEEVRECLEGIVRKGVASKRRDGAIYNRRMVRIAQQSQARSDAGRKAATIRWSCESDAKNAAPTPTPTPTPTPSPAPVSEGLGIRTAASGSEPATAGKRKRRYSDEERTKIDKNCSWFYGRYFKAVRSHSPQEPKPGRFPHPADARAALKLSGLLEEHKPDRVDAMLKDWLAGKYLSVPGDTLASFVAVFGKLLNPASRKREWVDERPGSDRKSTGSGGFRSVKEVVAGQSEARNGN